MNTIFPLFFTVAVTRGEPRVVLYDLDHCRSRKINVNNKGSQEQVLLLYNPLPSQPHSPIPLDFLVQIYCLQCWGFTFQILTFMIGPSNMTYLPLLSQFITIYSRQIHEELKEIYGFYTSYFFNARGIVSIQDISQ